MSIRVDGRPHIPIRLLPAATATLNLRSTLEHPTELAVVVFAVKPGSMADNPLLQCGGTTSFDFPQQKLASPLGIKPKLDVKVFVELLLVSSPRG